MKIRKDVYVRNSLLSAVTIFHYKSMYITKASPMFHVNFFYHPCPILFACSSGERERDRSKINLCRSWHSKKNCAGPYQAQFDTAKWPCFFSRKTQRIIRARLKLSINYYKLKNRYVSFFKKKLIYKVLHKRVLFITV